MKAICYMISCIIMFTSSLAYIPGTGYIRFPYFLKYGIAFLWFVFSIFKYLLKGNFRIEFKYLKTFGAYVFPILLMVGSVAVSIIVNQNYSFSYFTRSASNIVCMFCIITGVFAALNEFGNKAIDYAFWGLVGSTILNIAYTTYLYGAKAVLIVLLNVLKVVTFSYEAGSMEANVGYSLEVADATFAYGFFFLFYFLFADHNKSRIRRLMLCLFGIYIGLKRIELLAILITIGVCKILIDKKKWSLESIQNILFVSMGLVSFLFLVLIKYNTDIFQFLDVHRVNLYSRLRDMYEISPLYVGKGFGYVNKWLEDVGATMYILENSHSEITRMYIELGCLGFGIWLLYYTHFLPQFINKSGNEKASKILLSFSIFIMITYLIDNTLNLFATQYCYLLIPIAVTQGTVKHKRIVLKWR